MELDESELVRRINAAMTLPEIDAVLPLVQQWMEAHPNDRFDTSRSMWGACHKMAQREDALEDVYPRPPR